MLLPCLAGREATGSQNLLKMRILLGSRRGRLKFHKTYTCASAEGSGVVTLFQAWWRVRSFVSVLPRRMPCKQGEAATAGLKNPGSMRVLCVSSAQCKYRFEEQVYGTKNRNHNLRCSLVRRKLGLILAANIQLFTLW